MPTPDTLRRLALIRYVYLMAVNQSRLPAPVHSFSVCTFQDAIETFLKLAMDVLGHLSKKNDPDTFWFYVNTTNELLSKRPKNPATLLHQSEIANINRARNDVKHNGLLMAAASVESCRVRASDFFTDNCQVVFGVPFDSLSLSILVAPEKARVHLDAATAALASGDHKQAVEQVALGHAVIIRHFQTGLALRGIDSRLYTAHDFQHARSAMHIESRETSRAIEELSSAVQKAIAALHEDSEAMRYGFDHMRSLRFKSIVPDVSRYGGAVHFHHRMRDYEHRKNYEKYTSEEVQFCVDYLIEIALTLQDRLASLPLIAAPSED